MRHSTVIFVTMILCFAFGCGSSTADARNSGAQTDRVEAGLHGTFAETRCVYNGPISMANTQDIYSIGSVTLDADGTGGKDFKLYTDSGCQNLLTTGSVRFTYSIAAQYGNIDVIQMTQPDPAGPDPTQSFFMSSYAVANGYYFDVDGSRPDAEPYATLPTAADVAGFQADPTGRGVLFTRR